VHFPNATFQAAKVNGVEGNWRNLDWRLTKYPYKGDVFRFDSQSLFGTLSTLRVTLDLVEPWPIREREWGMSCIVDLVYISQADRPLKRLVIILENVSAFRNADIMSS
jgi:hypothetical protein